MLSVGDLIVPVQAAARAIHAAESDNAEDAIATILQCMTSACDAGKADMTLLYCRGGERHWTVLIAAAAR